MKHEVIKCLFICFLFINISSIQRKSDYNGSNLEYVVHSKDESHWENIGNVLKKHGLALSKEVFI